MGEVSRVSKVTALLFVIFASLSTPVFATSNVEVVQSVPIETTLAVPGIRQTQEVWLEMIAAAQKTIDLEEFYIDSQPGQSLEPVLNAIRAAAARGVQIRFVIDSKFYQTYPNDANQLSQVPNIQVKTVDYNSQGGVQHSKYFVIDQSRTFLGSANFDWLALTHIHEIGLRIEDAQISAGLEAVFAKDWEMGSPVGNQGTFTFDLKSGLNLSSSGLSGFQLVASPPSNIPDGIPESLKAIIDLLNSAQSSVKIQMYEYTTKIYQSSTRWKTLDSAIRKAASRGVHIQLLVDAVALKAGQADLKALASSGNIEVRSVVIPEWSGGHLDYARLIHSKYFTVDNSSGWVGTENWSGSYFTSSRNVGVTLQSPDVVNQLNQIFDRVWNSTYASSL